MIEISKNKNPIHPAKTESFILDEQEIIKDLKYVLSKETQALTTLIESIPLNSTILIEKILNCTGRIIFSGMGKSGHIAKKLVATFSSLGTSSLFLHPSEALHGDLGMVLPQDLFIAISKSGTGFELEQILHILKSQGNYSTLICCADGILSKIADLTVKLPFQQEACLLNLAPTTSTTLSMAFGDAIAVTVSKLKKFDKNDFAKFHPSGALGKKLLLKVSSFINETTDLPLIYPETLFKELIVTITTKKLGVGIIIDKNNTLIGVITDGDLRRACELGHEVFNKTAKDLMTINPKTIKSEDFAYTALQLMEKFKITNLVVTGTNNSVIGLIHIHDLIEAGITPD